MLHTKSIFRKAHFLDCTQFAQIACATLLLALSAALSGCEGESDDGTGEQTEGASVNSDKTGSDKGPSGVGESIEDYRPYNPEPELPNLTSSVLTKDEQMRKLLPNHLNREVMIYILPTGIEPIPNVVQSAILVDNINPYLFEIRVDNESTDLIATITDRAKSGQASYYRAKVIQASEESAPGPKSQYHIVLNQAYDPQD